jgi:phosphate transport system permease protein
MGDSAAHALTLLSGALILLVLVLIAIQLIRLSMPALRHFGTRFFLTAAWDPSAENLGILSFVYGTVVTSVIALVIAVPFGMGTAVFLTEVAPRSVRGPVAFVVDMLAAIPSVVYGLWGIFVLAPLMTDHVAPLLEKYLGFLPLFRGPCYGVSILTASLVLSLMVVPFITSISREMLLTVPRELKEASFALGATHWETIWKVVLPYTRVGIGAAVVLALGRALGETMAVTMLIGNQPAIHASLLQPGYSMAAVIANEFTEATTPLYLSAVIAVGLALFAVTVVVNLAARLVLRRMQVALPR